MSYYFSRIKQHKLVLSKFGEVTGALLAEMLVAEIFEGKVVNGIGYDVECPDGRRIEVRSRVEGTDGKMPRITLSKKKMEVCSDIVAVRFDCRYQPVEVRLVPKSELKLLYEEYCQNDGSTAHIHWQKFCACEGAKDLLAAVRVAYEGFHA